MSDDEVEAFIGNPIFDATNKGGERIEHPELVKEGFLIFVATPEAVAAAQGHSYIKPTFENVLR